MKLGEMMSIKRLLLTFVFLLIFFTNGFSYRKSLRDSSNRTNNQINSKIDESKRSHNRYRNKNDNLVPSRYTNDPPLTDRFFWDFSFNITRLKIKEYVFIDDYVLSRLDWKFKNKFDLKVDMTYRISKKINFKGSLTCSLPLKNGTMDDYDWAETDVATNYTQSGVLTHQSHHKNKIDYDFNLDFSFELKVSRSKFYEFYPLVGWKLRFLKMSGYDGYGFYPWGYQKFSGKVIEYSHLRSIVYLGIKNKFNICDWFSISLKSLYSPVAYIKAVDNHIERHPPLVFREYMLFGNYFYNEISIKVNFSENYALTFNVNHTYIPTFEGKSYVEIDGITYINASAGGTSVNDLSLGMGLAFKI